uniref:(northern house mosquito) hypothetical protein n=1 Tax=Culex pipiens TaxID=7175 RepID=A0A8D8CND9_CULPI
MTYIDIEEVFTKLQSNKKKRSKFQRIAQPALFQNVLLSFISGSLGAVLKKMHKSVQILPSKQKQISFTVLRETKATNFVIIFSFSLNALFYRQQFFVVLKHVQESHPEVRVAIFN